MSKLNINKVKETKRCCCWAHIRRYLLEAIPKGQEKDYSNPAVQGVLYCNKLFEYERTYMEKELSFKQIHNREDFLMTYLEDGRCSLSNNLSENSIRPVTVGRKNWLFSDTPDGASANALYLTIVEMSKAYNLNLYEYLKYLLEHRPNRDMTDAEFAKLAPWNEDVQRKCCKKNEQNVSVQES